MEELRGNCSVLGGVSVLIGFLTWLTKHGRTTQIVLRLRCIKSESKGVVQSNNRVPIVVGGALCH